MDDVVILICVLGASAISVGLVVALNVWLGGWTPVRLDTIEAAARAVEDQVLGFESSDEAVLARGGRAALILERGDQPRLGLAATGGDRVVVRVLRPGELRSAERDGAVLTLLIDDYTFPRAWLTLEDADQAEIWLRRVQAYVRPAAPRSVAA